MIGLKWRNDISTNQSSWAFQQIEFYLLSLNKQFRRKWQTKGAFTLNRFRCVFVKKKCGFYGSSTLKRYTNIGRFLKTVFSGNAPKKVKRRCALTLRCERRFNKKFTLTRLLFQWLKRTNESNVYQSLRSLLACYQWGSCELTVFQAVICTTECIELTVRDSFYPS